MYQPKRKWLISRIARQLLPAIAGVLFLTIIPAQLQAAFTGDFSLGNFTLINMNADGSWLTPDAGQTLALTGGDTGSWEMGDTWFLLPAPRAVNITFQYRFLTLDVFDDPDHPLYDTGGYLLGGIFHPLSTTAIAGSVAFSAAQGEYFGFGVRTHDNFGGPGVLYITNFQAQDAGAATPEPHLWPALALALALGGAIHSRRARSELRS